MTLEDLISLCKKEGISYYLEPSTNEEKHIDKIASYFNTFPAFALMGVDLYIMYEINNVMIYSKLTMNEAGNNTDKVLRKMGEIYKCYLKKKEI